MATGRYGAADPKDHRKPKGGRVGKSFLDYLTNAGEIHSDTSRPFDKPTSGRIAVKVINHLGDEVMKVFRVN